MGRIFVSAESNRAGAAEVKLVDGDSLFLLASEPDWGNAAWDSIYSGPRGTLGARLAGADIQNRTIRIPLQIRASTHDALETKMARVWELADDLHRFGGIITFRPEGGSFKQYFDVLEAGARIVAFDRLFHLNGIVAVELGAVCSPYLRMDSFDIYDGFDTDATMTDYTVDAAGGGFTMAGGLLVPAATGTARWRHTARNFVYSDVEVSLKLLTGSTVTSYTAEVFCSGNTSGTETFVAAQLTSSALNIIKRTNGTPSTLATTAVTPTASTRYWLKVTRAGRVYKAALYTTEPGPQSSAAFSTAYASQLGELPLTGHTGFRLNVVSTLERYDDFRVNPNTYGGPVDSS